MWDALASKFQPSASIYLCKKLFSFWYVDGTSMETFLHEFSSVQDDFIACSNNLGNDFFSYMILCALSNSWSPLIQGLQT